MNYSIKMFLIFSLLFSFGMRAQSPCEHPNSNEFDFWIGEWNLTWKDKNGNLLKGENSVKYILDSCVIQENFHSFEDGFKGISHSVYIPQIDSWKQTWVSNKGGYLDFAGKMDGDKMILSRSYQNKEGSKLYQRMIWYNIKENSLDWNWEKSSDGQHWETAWKIHYKRK